MSTLRVLRSTARVAISGIRVTATPGHWQARCASTAQNPKSPASSVLAGTAIRGVNYFKNKPDPIALPDSEYPDWLWTCLESKIEAGNSLEADLFAKSKKKRRAAAKALRKQALLHPELLIPKVPVAEQTIDLPHNSDGTIEGALEAQGARVELRRALRQKRRASIKEANYLSTMK